MSDEKFRDVSDAVAFARLFAEEVNALILKLQEEGKARSFDGQYLVTSNGNYVLIRIPHSSLWEEYKRLVEEMQVKLDLNSLIEKLRLAIINAPTIEHRLITVTYYSSVELAYESILNASGTILVSRMVDLEAKRADLDRETYLLRVCRLSENPEGVGYNFFFEDFIERPSLETSN